MSLSHNLEQTHFIFVPVLESIPFMFDEKGCVL